MPAPHRGGRPRRARMDGGGPSAPLWCLTFSDMMSLVLTFFVLLASFSTVSEQGFKQAQGALQQAFGVLDQSNGMVSSTPRRSGQGEAEQGKRRGGVTRQVARGLQKRMQDLANEADIRVEFDEEGGLKVSLPSRVLFVTGSAQLMPEAYPVLEEVAAVLRDVPESFVEVRGHTDDQPVTPASGFRDNYDLSYARADAVTRRLIEFGRLPITQFEIHACGSSQPIASNATAEGRQTNRRVEINVRGAFNRTRLETWRREAQKAAAVPAPLSPPPPNPTPVPDTNPPGPR